MSNETRNVIITLVVSVPTLILSHIAGTAAVDTVFSAYEKAEEKTGKEYKGRFLVSIVSCLGVGSAICLAGKSLINRLKK